MRYLDDSYGEFVLFDEFLDGVFDVVLVVAEADDVWFDLL